MKPVFKFGDKVTFMWGAAEVHGIVREVYGAGEMERVVVDFPPSLDWYVDEERTTVSLPANKILRSKSFYGE